MPCHLADLQEEETRLGRLVITGQICEDAYARLWSEWNEKVVNVLRKIEELEFDASQYLDDSAGFTILDCGTTIGGRSVLVA